MSDNTAELCVTSRERDLIVRALEEHRIDRSDKGYSTYECDALLATILDKQSNEKTIVMPEFINID